MAETKEASPQSENYMQASPKLDSAEYPSGGQGPEIRGGDQKIPLRPAVDKRQRLVMDVRDELLGTSGVTQHNWSPAI